MMKTFMTTSAVAALLAGAAFAQTDPATDTAPATEEVMPESAETSGDSGDTDIETGVESAAEGAAEAGSDAAEATGDAAGELATEAEDALEEVGDALTEPMEGDGNVPDAAMDTSPAAETMDGGSDMAREGWGDPEEGQTRVALDTVSADDLLGADIRSRDTDDTIATVADVLLDEGGSVEHVVAEFGGFLGFGQKTVLLGADNVDILTTLDDGAPIIRTNLDAESLEAMPEFEAEM